jgi:hypothetical protein
MPKEFEIIREVELPGRPEDVWEAVATNAGNASWLFPSDSEPGANATVWDPPHHFSVREEGPDGFFNELDFRIGVIDYLKPNFAGVRTGDALYRFFGRNAFGGPVGMSIHHFADGVDPEATGAAWTTWMERVYA